MIPQSKRQVIETGFCGFTLIMIWGLKDFRPHAPDREKGEKIKPFQNVSCTPKAVKTGNRLLAGSFAIHWDLLELRNFPASVQAFFFRPVHALPLAASSAQAARSIPCSRLWTHAGL